jgi:hypothetical protein
VGPLYYPFSLASPPPLDTLEDVSNDNDCHSVTLCPKHATYLISLLLSDSLGWGYYCSYFVGEKTDIQRGSFG